MTTLTADQGMGRIAVGLHAITAAHVWAVARLGLAWVFLWAFLDKTFALGFATGRAQDGSIDFFSERAWIRGGSPTEGFLTFGTKGPFADTFQGMAGDLWVDGLFMIGLLAIGTALLLGVGMRLAAVAGALLLLLMWLAQIWPANNPFLDSHLIYGVVIIGLAAMNAGDTWGFGKWWAKTEAVRRYPILR
ncbi:MAG: hypothetical protein ACC645_24705 [Pirellulales bacterium]